MASQQPTWERARGAESAVDRERRRNPWLLRARGTAVATRKGPRACSLVLHSAEHMRQRRRQQRLRAAGGAPPTSALSQPNNRAMARALAAADDAAMAEAARRRGAAQAAYSRRMVLKDWGERSTAIHEDHEAAIRRRRADFAALMPAELTEMRRHGCTKLQACFRAMRGRRRTGRRRKEKIREDFQEQLAQGRKQITW